jgi:glycosyltransferase involved in cell wall biosynthesis
MSTIRVLMAVPCYPFPVVGGLERQSHELAKTLVQRGHTVSAISSRFDATQRDVELIDGVRVHRVKWISFKPARFLVVAFGLVKILAKLRQELDLIHVHNISWFGGFVSILARVLGLPVITKLPNSGDFGIPLIQQRAFASMRIRVLKGSAAIIAMTPESVTELASIGYPVTRVLKVTNGIPWLPAPSRQPRSSPTVNAIFVGRLSSEKGLLDLLHAWAVLKAGVSVPVRLRLVGEGPQAEELRALAKSLDLEQTVEFLGHCSDIPAQLANADLFVLPSYAEGNSNAILEAMRAGLPIVATRIGGAQAQVGSAGERFLVSSGDRETLSARLLELIENEALRLQLGAAMRARIESIFLIDRIAATYESAYDFILRGHPEEIGNINVALFAQNTRTSVKYT